MNILHIGLICREFLERLAAKQMNLGLQPADAAKFKERLGKSHKYGVDWQANATRCQLCYKKWSTLRRKYNCRMCGQMVCNSCSRTRTRVPGSTNLKRVCDHCKQRLAAEDVSVVVHD